MPDNNFNIIGLHEQEVLESRELYGSNVLEYKKEHRFLDAIRGLAAEPMVILLFVAASIYFISGHPGDGIFLSIAILLVATISLYQNARSKNALAKLKEYSQVGCKVIRNGKVMIVRTDEVVVGDSLMVEEGSVIQADGVIIHSNDYSVNESILTGESMAVFKDVSSVNNLSYRGTTVASGLAILQVSAIGNETKLGKIGKSLEGIVEEKTPLEIQINDFVKKMVISGAVVFLLVWIINYTATKSILDSLLKALTLAMSILPEEIPVAFTTFMALGAWRMMKIGVVVKQMKTVETLGSATVICTDKTGTITENKMSLADIFAWPTRQYYNSSDKLADDGISLIKAAMWSSEPIPFDPMEVAIHQTYGTMVDPDQRPKYKIVKEYPLSGRPPMMTHVFEDQQGDRIIAAKGAPEALMNVSSLSSEEIDAIKSTVNLLASKGYRVLGVGVSTFKGNDFPQTQQELIFDFKGIISFYDPPKKNIDQVFKEFYSAGIEVKIITGDNAPTTQAIAKEVGLRGYDQSISGDELMALSAPQLQKVVKEAAVFTRMFPEAKLKIINALKKNQEIVAMTGDGVNDGPALKAAHIGIAMGKRGTEIAKQAASLVLVDDDLSKMVEAVWMGRKIYANLKKAIQYIISIHIPIILTVFIPLILGWVYPNIFSPIHIIFMELIMGPTCSIIYENEPMESNVYQEKPRPYTSTFFNWKELTTSVLQGLLISCGTLAVYQWAWGKGYNEDLTRSMVFTTLITANIFLTLVNRSFYYSVITTSRYKNNLVPMIILVTILITGLLLYVRPFAVFFGFEGLTGGQLGISSLIGLMSVIWYEGVKWINRRRYNSHAQGTAKVST